MCRELGRGISGQASKLRESAKCDLLPLLNSLIDQDSETCYAQHKGAGVQTLGYPAIQLFLERPMEVAGGYKVTDSDVMEIADLCRELNGVPLAIELAVGCVRSLSLSSTVSDHIFLSNQRQRTGPRRQPEFSVSLDWSFDYCRKRNALFSEDFRIEGSFDLDTGIAIGSEGVLGKVETIECIEIWFRSHLLSVWMVVRPIFACHPYPVVMRCKK